MSDDVILFDGVCGFCDSAVRFILHTEREPHFRFAPLQSPAGKKLLAEHGLSPDWMTSYVLISRGKAYMKSAATFRITPWLRYPWRAYGVFQIVPRAINDLFYDILAHNRYRWFGKFDSCRLLTPELESRFLEGSRFD